MIGLVAAVAILAAAGGDRGVARHTARRAPQAVAEDYLRALSVGDFAGIEGLLAEGGADAGVAGTALRGRRVVHLRLLVRPRGRRLPARRPSTLM